MQNISPGMLVFGPAGQIGTVSGLSSTDDQARLIIRTNEGNNLIIPAGNYQLVGEIVRVAADPANTAFTAEQNTTSANDDTIVVPVIEEQIRIDRQVVEHGGVRVHKRIVEREEVIEQPTFREEVSVERIAIGREIESAPEPRQEGDTLVIPIVEEMLVVEKRLVLKEELRITRRRIEEIEEARVVVRAEQVEIEQLPDQLSIREVGDSPVA